MTDNPTTVREEAMALSNSLAVETVDLVLRGEKPPHYLAEAGRAAREVALRAAAVEMDEVVPLTAAMESISPTDFARRVRARRRMAQLTKEDKR